MLRQQPAPPCTTQHHPAPQRNGRSPDSNDINDRAQRTRHDLPPPSTPQHHHGCTQHPPPPPRLHSNRPSPHITTTTTTTAWPFTAPESLRQQPLISGWVVVDSSSPRSDFQLLTIVEVKEGEEEPRDSPQAEGDEGNASEGSSFPSHLPSCPEVCLPQGHRYSIPHSCRHTHPGCKRIDSRVHVPGASVQDDEVARKQHRYLMKERRKSLAGGIPERRVMRKAQEEEQHQEEEEEEEE
ncbi:hypothetical protein O3P69_013603 [Scylla paramamosain]|uniref:Uncharacterized protein n=1 Tax=Scylla paramamosain TaxID=85552 RepID=A0AAW0SNV9_SCYPA